MTRNGVLAIDPLPLGDFLHAEFRDAFDQTSRGWARTFGKMFGNGGGTTGVDDEFAARGFSNIGAWILGRNMFGPMRGPWPDENWKGWWGGNPPYHTPVFVLTNHARASIAMDGGTTFPFVTEGIRAALKRAAEAANGQDIRLSGGVATIQQYLRAGLVDEMHVAVAPAFLGSLFIAWHTLGSDYYP